MPRRRSSPPSAHDRPERLDAILRAGVDVARINFSHGTADEHLARIARSARGRRQRKFAAVLADLPGPKLRVRIPVAARTRRRRHDPLLARRRTRSTPTTSTLTEPEVLADVRPGQRMLLDDGRLQLEAGAVDGGRLAARGRRSAARCSRTRG